MRHFSVIIIEPTSRQMNRIVYIDIAKAICIILVVIGHYCPPGHPAWWRSVCDFIYSFHMPLFMFASGFVYIATKRAGENYRDFIIKKVKRLMVPYFTVSVIVISIKLLTERYAYVENPVTLFSYVQMFYYPEAGFFLWFIWALWWMFVLVPLFKTKEQRLLLFCVSILIHYIPFATTELFCISSFKDMLLFFMLGVVLYDWKEAISGVKRVPEWAFIAAFAIAYSISVSGPSFGGGYLAAGAGLSLPYLGIAAIIALSRMIEKSSTRIGCLMTISSSSYIIYLFHTTFEGFAKALLFKMPYLNNIGDSLIFAIGAAIVVACGVLIPILLNEKVFKKYYITKTLFGLK